MTRKSLVTFASAGALAVSACGGDPNFAGAPDVRGLNLRDANSQLKKAGFSSTVVESDGVFGVVIEENFVVCDQEDTKGRIVPVQVAKHGC